MQGFTFILLCGLLLAPAAAAERAAPQARDGAIDLSDWDFARDGIADLAGEWRIAWGRFEDPSAPPDAAAARGRIAVPGPWNAAEVPGKTPGAFGHATYRLEVACRAPGRLALVLPVQHSAARYYVNGRVLAVQGNPGGSRELARPGFVQQIATLDAAACPLQIVAHVSNYDMRLGGLLRAVELGDERQVLARRERGLARDLFSLGGVLVLSLLPVLFWLWRREDRAPLWLGVYGLSASLFIAIGGERVAQPWIAPLGWEVAWKIVLVAMTVGLAAFPSFVRALYPAHFPRLAHRALLVPLALLGLLILATPARIYTQAVPLMYALWIAVGACCVLVLVRAALGGRRGAWVMLAGFALLTAAGVHDTVQVSYQIASKLTPYGLFAFSVAPALLLARRFARALRAEELRSVEQQQRADLLVHATQAGLLDWDATSNVATYSDRFKEMLGYPADTDTAKWPPLFDFIHPEDRERVRASFLAQLRDRGTRGGVRLSHDPADYRLRRADGSYSWIHAEAISLTGADGRTLRYICSFIDISERKQQEFELADRVRVNQQLLAELRRGEAALRESDARYHFAMRAINEGIYDWNVRDGSIYYSESVYRALGMPESMRTPQDWRERIHPEDQARYAAAIVAHFKGETSRFECDYRFRGGDGGWRWARQRGIAMRDEYGRAVRMVGTTGDITDLKLAEIALADRAKFIQDLFDSVPVALTMRDTDGRYLLVNRRWEEYFGARREDVVGQSLRERASPRVADAVLALDRAVLERGPGAMQQEDDFEYRGRKFSQTRSVMADPGGRVLGVLVASIDTTERAAMDARLRAQIALTQTIVAQAPNSIFAKDREGRFTLANRGWSEMSGIPAEQAIGRTVHDLYPAEAAKRFADEDAKLLAQGAAAPPVEQMHTGPRPDQYRIVRKAVLSRDGEVLGLVCSSTDVTELKRMELALERGRERLELLVRATKAGFMDWDAASDTRSYSERFKEMLGHPRDADTSTWPSLFDMMHPEDRERMRDAFREMLRQGAQGGERMHGPLEYRLRKTDGSYVWVRGEGIAQVGADGRTERFLTSYIDITHLREMNLALEESVRLREEVDRISRHDLKTPLNSIIGIPRLLRDSGRLSAEDAELLAFVEQAGYRLLNMVNLSLDMFQMERGSYPFTPKPVDLRELLGKVVRDLDGHARSKRLALRIEGPALYARAEELLCYSMFANLVKNAIEASPDRGEIRLSLSSHGEEARVSVHNAGAVPEAVRARFFDKYSTAGKQSGSGLGTYSARLMARTQQGEIEMQTGDAGTTLSVRLMLTAAPDPEALPEPGEKPAEPKAAAKAQALSVLVVDDDDYTRIFVQRFLPASMRSRAAVNGREAVDAVREDPPDVIVMDLDMPVMGGLEAATQIRQWEREAGRARCAMIAMSSNDGPAVASRCAEAGFDRYLAKPVSPDVLRRALADLSLAQDAVFVDPDLKDALPGFLESRREMADALAQALAGGSAEAARALAHKLAGSFALYGFEWAAQQSRLIETRARENRLEGLAGEAASLRRHLDGVQVRFAGRQTAEAKA